MKTNCKHYVIKTTDKVHVAKVCSNPGFVPIGKVYKDLPLGTSLYFVILNWFYIVFGLVLLNWEGLASDLTLTFNSDFLNPSFLGFCQIAATFWYLVNTYIYSSKHWVVQISLINYFLLVLFFCFSTTNIDYLYLQIGVLVVLSTFFFCVLASGGFLTLSKFYSLNYLNNPHHDLSASNFFKVWLTYIEIMLPRQEFKIQKNHLSIPIIVYSLVTFFFLVVYGILISYIRILIIFFFFSPIKLGDGIDTFIVLHIIGLVLICFDDEWRANFNKVVGEDAVHFLGYNSPEQMFKTLTGSLLKGKAFVEVVFKDIGKSDVVEGAARAATIGAGVATVGTGAATIMGKFPEKAVSGKSSSETTNSVSVESPLTKQKIYEEVLRDKEGREQLAMEQRVIREQSERLDASRNDHTSGLARAERERVWEENNRLFWERKSKELESLNQQKDENLERVTKEMEVLSTYNNARTAALDTREDLLAMRERELAIREAEIFSKGGKTKVSISDRIEIMQNVLNNTENDSNTNAEKISKTKVSISDRIEIMHNVLNNTESVSNTNAESASNTNTESASNTNTESASNTNTEKSSNF